MFALCLCCNSCCDHADCSPHRLYLWKNNCKRQICRFSGWEFPTVPCAKTILLVDRFSFCFYQRWPAFMKQNFTLVANCVNATQDAWPHNISSLGFVCCVESLNLCTKRDILFSKTSSCFALMANDSSQYEEALILLYMNNASFYCNQLTSNMT